MKLIDGKIYNIDIQSPNGGKVKLISHGKHFCLVQDPDNGEMWETMVYRLTECEGVILNSKTSQNDNTKH